VALELLPRDVPLLSFSLDIAAESAALVGDTFILVGEVALRFIDAVYCWSSAKLLNVTDPFPFITGAAFVYNSCRVGFGAAIRVEVLPPP